MMRTKSRNMPTTSAEPRAVTSHSGQKWKGQWGAGEHLLDMPLFCALAGGVCSVQGRQVCHRDAMLFVGAINHNCFSTRLHLSPRHQLGASE
jgi:hypothetical protein